MFLEDSLKERRKYMPVEAERGGVGSRNKRRGRRCRKFQLYSHCFFPQMQRSAQPAADFVCPVCKQSFCAAEEQAAMIHFAGHLDERPNHCIECQQAFSSRHDFVQHLRVHVLKPSKYHRQQCDVCGEASLCGFLFWWCDWMSGW